LIGASGKQRTATCSLMPWDYIPKNIQTVAAKRPTNQTTEAKNNQSSRVMRLKPQFGLCVHGAARL
jgi:hypothetical protein